MTFKKGFLAVFIAAFLVAVFYANGFITRHESQSPCQKPILYSIGSFETRFGISRPEFLNAITQAKQVWEKPANRELFRFSDRGNLQINLVDKGIQEKTLDLQQLNKRISQKKGSYESFKKQYSDLKASYELKKASYQRLFSDYENKKGDYDSKVAYWNSQGGAPEEEYQKLQQEKALLVETQNRLNTSRQDLNGIAENINALARQLNALAAESNLDVEKYNDSELVGKEFRQGLYIQDSSGRRIEIYQFDNYEKLVRVLTHELGHALGLEHVDNPKAIMYRLHEGQNNDTLTADDIIQLKQICAIPN